MSVFRMAWRNVWRNKRRSIVTISAMTLALFVMVLYAGLLTGYFIGMERNVLDLELGDVQVHASGYLDKPSLYTAIDDPDALLARLDAESIPAAARLQAGGLCAAGDSSAGVLLIGVDPERDLIVSAAGKAVDRGEWLDPADPHGVVLGRGLARTLAVDIGDELVVLSQGADGSLANDLYTVRGVLKVVSDSVDRTTVFRSAPAFRELMVFPRGAHKVIARRPAGADLDTTAAMVRKAAPDLDVKTWRELMPLIATMLDSSQQVMFVVLFVVYLAVGILILNAMLMAVLERVREFGVLKAIGMGPLKVFGLILIESGVQTGIAMATGLLLSLPAMWYLATYGIDTGKMGGMSVMGIAMDPTWYGVYSVKSLTGPVIMLAGIVLVAVLYPAFKAAWVRPIQALQHR